MSGNDFKRRDTESAGVEHMASVTRLRPEKKYAMDIIKAFPGGTDRKILYDEAEKLYKDVPMCHKVQAAIYRELQKRGDRGKDELFGNEDDELSELMTAFEEAIEAVGNDFEEIPESDEDLSF